jgi:hypothetical protein
MVLTNNYIAALHVDTTGSWVGYEVYEARFDGTGVVLAKANQAKFTHAARDGGKLCAKCVLTTDDDVVFGVNWVLHVADDGLESVTVHSCSVFVVGSTTVTLDAAGVSAVSVYLEPDYNRRGMCFAGQLA